MLKIKQITFELHEMNYGGEKKTIGGMKEDTAKKKLYATKL